jgi:hypothetical protein
VKNLAFFFKKMLLSQFCKNQQYFEQRRQFFRHFLRKHCINHNIGPSLFKIKYAVYEETLAFKKGFKKCKNSWAIAGSIGTQS